MFKAKIHTLTFTLLSFAITSCNVDLNYKPEHAVKIPTAWHAKDKQITKTTCAPGCVAWWKQFHDPVLNQLIKQGLQQNNDIHIAQANIEAALGELRRVKLNWVPSMDANFGYSSFPYLGYPGVLVAAIPSFTLNILHQLKEQERAKAELHVTQHMRDAVQLAVIAHISGSYFSYLAQQEQLHLLQRVENDLSERTAIYKSTYQQGFFSNIEYTDAQSAVALIQAREKIIQQQMVVHQNTLHYLLSENPETLSFKRQFKQLHTDHKLIGALPLTIIEQRPDMVQAANQFKAANAGIGLAVSDLLPTIGISAARGDIATIPNGTTLGTPIYFNQAILDVPLLHLSDFGKIDKARAMSKAAYFHYLKTLRNVLREVDTRLSAHELSTQHLEETQLAAKKRLHAYQLNEKLYQQGIISYLNLLDERIKLDKIKILVNQQKLEQLMATVNVSQSLALGVGCARPSTKTPIHQSGPKTHGHT